MRRKVPVDYVHAQVSIRGFAAWLTGTILGFYIGVRLGLPGNLAPVVGGILGLFVGGVVFGRLVKALWRSTPKYTVSLRTASSANFGMMIGAVIAGFLGDKLQAPTLICFLSGMAIGLLVGGFIGHASTRAALQEEQRRAMQEGQPSLDKSP